MNFKNIELFFNSKNLELDKLLAYGIAFVSFLILIININDWYLHYVVLVVLFASILYMLIRDRLIKDNNPIISNQTTTIFKILNIIFIVSILIAITSLWNSLYYRPIIFFIMIGIALFTILYDIVIFNTDNKYYCAIIQGKIILIGILIYASIYWEFPGIYGSDSWLHNEWIIEIINIGHLTEGIFVFNSYVNLPIFQLSGAGLSIITNLNLYSSIFLSNSVFLTLTCIFITYIGKEVFDTKIGLIAGLLTVLSNMGIRFGTDVFPNTLGFCFFTIGIYLIFTKPKSDIRYTSLIIFFSLILIFTHTISAFILCLILFLIVGSSKVYLLFEISKNKETFVSLAFAIFFAIVLFFHWMHAVVPSGVFFENSVMRFFEIKQSQGILLIGNVVTDPLGYLLSELGYYILILFGIIGILICLKSDNRTLHRWELISCWALLIICPTVLKVIKISIIPERWLIFDYLFLTLIAIFGAVSLIKTLQNKQLKVIYICIICMFILGFMIINPQANVDVPPIFNNAERYGYTASEIKTIQWLSENEAGCPITDLHYGNIFPYIMGIKNYTKMSDRINTVFIDRNFYLFHKDWNLLFKTNVHKGGSNDNYIAGMSTLKYKQENRILEKSLIYKNGVTYVYAMDN